MHDLSEMNRDQSNFYIFLTSILKKKGLKYLEKKYFNSKFVKLFSTRRKTIVNLN